MYKFSSVEEDFARLELLIPGYLLRLESEDWAPDVDPEAVAKWRGGNMETPETQNKKFTQDALKGKQVFQPDFLMSPSTSERVKKISADLFDAEHDKRDKLHSTTLRALATHGGDDAVNMVIGHPKFNDQMAQDIVNRYQAHEAGGETGDEYGIGNIFRPLSAAGQIFTHPAVKPQTLLNMHAGLKNAIEQEPENYKKFNENLPFDQFDWPARFMMFKNKNLPEPLVRDLLSSTYRPGVAHSHYSQPSGDLGMHAMIQHPNLPSDFIADKLQSKDPMERHFALHSNKVTPQQLQYVINNDTSHEVLGAALRHPKVNPRVMIDAWNGEPEIDMPKAKLHMREAHADLAKNPSATSEDLHLLFSKAQKYLHTNPNKYDNVVNTFSTIAKNPKTSDETLKGILSEEPSFIDLVTERKSLSNDLINYIKSNIKLDDEDKQYLNHHEFANSIPDEPVVRKPTKKKVK